VNWIVCRTSRRGKTDVKEGRMRRNDGEGPAHPSWSPGRTTLGSNSKSRDMTRAGNGGWGGGEVGYYYLKEGIIVDQDTTVYMRVKNAFQFLNAY